VKDAKKKFANKKPILNLGFFFFSKSFPFWEQLQAKTQRPRKVRLACLGHQPIVQPFATHTSFHQDISSLP